MDYANWACDQSHDKLCGGNFKKRFLQYRFYQILLTVLHKWGSWSIINNKSFVDRFVFESQNTKPLKKWYIWWKSVFISEHKQTRVLIKSGSKNHM